MQRFLKPYSGTREDDSNTLALLANGRICQRHRIIGLVRRPCDAVRELNYSLPWSYGLVANDATDLAYVSNVEDIIWFCWELFRNPMASKLANSKPQSRSCEPAANTLATSGLLHGETLCGSGHLAVLLSGDQRFCGA